MNKYFSIFFLMILFLTGGQTFSLFSQNPSPEDLKYLKLLPEGKIRKYCEKNYSNYSSSYSSSQHFSNYDYDKGYNVESLNRMIWSAVKEKECASMTEAEQLALEDVGRVWSGHDHLLVCFKYCPNNGPIKRLSSGNWKKDNFKCVREVVLAIAQNMQLPLEQKHQELAKVIAKFIEFREDIEKAKKISEKRRRMAIDQGGKKTSNKKTCLPEGLINSSDRPDIPSNIILGED